MSTQNAALKAHLLAHSSITQLSATITLGILRLSERIRELAAEGWNIAHNKIKVPTRYGKSAWVTEYVLISAPVVA
jgi:hypothetical protein